MAVYNTEMKLSPSTSLLVAFRSAILDAFVGGRAKGQTSARCLRCNDVGEISQCSTYIYIHIPHNIQMYRPTKFTHTVMGLI